MLSSKVSILRTDTLKLLCGRIHYLNITRQIFIAVDFRKIVERLIRDLRDVKFMIANRQEVIIHIFEDGVGNVPVGRCGIAQSSTIMEILLN